MKAAETHVERLFERARDKYDAEAAGKAAYVEMIDLIKGKAD